MSVYEPFDSQRWVEVCWRSVVDPIWFGSLQVYLLFFVLFVKLRFQKKFFFFVRTGTRYPATRKPSSKATADRGSKPTPEKRYDFATLH